MARLALTGARRAGTLVDELAIDTGPRGTTVTVTKWKRPIAALLRRDSRRA